MTRRNRKTVQPTTEPTHRARVSNATMLEARLWDAVGALDVALALVDRIGNGPGSPSPAVTDAALGELTRLQHDLSALANDVPDGLTWTPPELFCPSA